MSIASEIARLQQAKADLKAAINSKGGNITTEKIDQFAAEVTALPSPKEEETRTLTPDFSNGDVVITPDSDKVLRQVTIVKDSDLVPENIKSGVTIFGITGTYSGGVTGYTLTVSLTSIMGSSITVKHADGTQTTYPENTTSIADVVEIISINYSDSLGSFTINGSSPMYPDSLPYTLTQDSTLVGNFYCLTGDMLVTMADNSTKRLDEIKVGDEILSYDWNTMSLVPNKVIFTDKDENKSFKEYHKWTFDDGTIIKTVHRHRFYNVEAKQFKYMDMWSIGEHAYKQDGSMPMLVSHELITEDVRHYKITGEIGTNYFVNGLLTGDRNCPKNIELGCNNK